MSIAGLEGGSRPGVSELTIYVITIAAPLLLGLTVGAAVLTGTGHVPAHPHWLWQMGAVVAGTTITAVLAWLSEQCRTVRGLSLAGGSRRRAHVEARLRRGLVVPAEGRDLAEQIASAQLQNRWVPVVLGILPVYWLGTAWTNDGFSFWFALILPPLLLPTWASDWLRRRSILAHAREQGINPGRGPGRSPIPW